MTYETILAQSQHGVFSITLNRPEVYNAFNTKMLDELSDALKACEKDNSARVLVLTGSGKAFGTGQDLKEVKTNFAFKETIDKKYNPLIKKLTMLEKPTVCAINGVAAGAGLSLAMACDVRLMSDASRLVCAFVRVGLVPDSGLMFNLVRTLGYSKAFEIATLGDAVSASDAVRLGLVNRVVAAESLQAETQTLAERYAKAPSYAIGLIKRGLSKAVVAPFDEMLDLESYFQELAGRSADYAEGKQAFLEKRPAQFKGV
jgi:2-(1,2-epoxy-1,2-dihydrophenyl)acetyl-CoA isomerase